MTIKIISFNICNDEDFIYGNEDLTEEHINNFIKYYMIIDNNLIEDLKKLLKVLEDDNISCYNNLILNYHIHNNKLRSIKINVIIKNKNYIRYITNLCPKMVDIYIRNKNKLLYKTLKDSDVDFIFLQNVEDHYKPDENYLEDYSIINPIKIENRCINNYYGILSNYIIYKSSFVLINSYIKDFGTVSIFNINNKEIKLITGKFVPLPINKQIRLKQLEILDNEEGNIIFIGDTNLTYNENLKKKNIQDGIVKFKIPVFYTINKYTNLYYNDDFNNKYVSRYDKIYLNIGQIIYANNCFTDKYDILKNIYRISGCISDHYGLLVEIKI